jgi:succinoglycan biosynthesis protein ExoO
MPVDVSVVMPAYRAQTTIGRAIASILAQQGVVAELVLCADDDLDYWALVPDELRSRSSVTLCRTPNPKSGPSLARNVALSHARADIIASLDADDGFGPQRLARLLPLVERHGLATGPTREVNAASRRSSIGPCARKVGHRSRLRRMSSSTSISIVPLASIRSRKAPTTSTT